MDEESTEQKFIKLAVRSIEAQAISLPFALNSVIEVSVIIPAQSFDIFYQAFTDRAIFILTVVDLQCIFEGLIMEIHQDKNVEPKGHVGCRMRISSIYRVIFDNSITEKGVIAQLEYERFKLGQGQAEAKPHEDTPVQKGIEVSSSPSS